MTTDQRSRRVAVVEHRLVNPPAGGLDALAELERRGWGVVALPPAGYPAAVARPLLAQVATHVEEFVRHGYVVIVVGRHPGLRPALARLGVPDPEAIAPRTSAELGAFLDVRGQR